MNRKKIKLRFIQMKNALSDPRKGLRMSFKMSMELNREPLRDEFIAEEIALNVSDMEKYYRCKISASKGMVGLQGEDYARNLLTVSFRIQRTDRAMNVKTLKFIHHNLDLRLRGMVAREAFDRLLLGGGEGKPAGLVKGVVALTGDMYAYETLKKLIHNAAKS